MAEENTINPNDELAAAFPSSSSAPIEVPEVDVTPDPQGELSAAFPHSDAANAGTHVAVPSPAKNDYVDPSATLAGTLTDPNFYKEEGDAALDAGKAFAHHFGNFFHGAANSAEQTAAGLGVIDNGLLNKFGIHAMDPVRDWLVNQAGSDQDALRQRETQYQASVPNNAGTYAGAAAGEIAPWLLGPGKVLGKLSDAATAPLSIGHDVFGLDTASRLAQTGLKGAIQGGASTLTQPNLNDDDFINRVLKNSMFGAGINYGLGALGQVGKAVAPFLSPSSVIKSNIANWLGGDLPSIKQNLENYEDYVPGVVPRTSQVAGNVPLAQIDKALGNTADYKTALTNRAVDNNSARLTYLNDVAGDPATRQAGVNARNADAQSFNEDLAAFGKPVDSNALNAQIDLLLKNGTYGTNPVTSKFLNSIKTMINSGADQNGQVRADWLDGIRRNVNSYMLDNTPGGLPPGKGSTEASVVQKIKPLLIQSIEDQNPGYKDYLQRYAEASGPINQRNVAAKVLNDLGLKTVNALGDPTMNLAGFNSLYNKHAGRLDYDLPQNLSEPFDALRSDLQREGQTSVPSTGSDTAYNLQANGWLPKILFGRSYQGGVGPLQAIGALIGAHMHGVEGAAAGAFGAHEMGGIAQKRLQPVLQNIMMNPKAFLDMLNPSATEIVNRAVAPAVIPAAVNAINNGNKQ